MSQTKPKFIYFDLDDTLLDHKKAEKAGLADVHRHFDEIAKVPFDHLISTYHGINKGLWEDYGKGHIDRHILHRKRFEETFLALGIDPSLYEKAGTVYMKYYRNHWEWVRGAKEAYEKVAASYPVGLITNGFAETQKMKIDQFGFEETAGPIIISEEFGVMKPHPDIFIHAAEKAGTDPKHILYVGDSLTSDVIGGTEAGWQVAWFTGKTTDEGKRRSSLVFNDFSDLINHLNI